MDPSFWGRSGWQMLFSIAMAYPEKKTDITKDIYNHYLEYFKIYRHVIPCKKCAKEYGEYLDKHPMDTVLKRGRKELVRWFYKYKKHNVDEAIKHEKKLWQAKKKELEAKGLSKTLIDRRECQYLKTQPSWPFDKVYEYYGTHLKKH